MQFSPTDAQALRRLLRWRRDMRHFEDRGLDEAVVDRLRRDMECAPSVGNSRPWRVIRVTDPSLRAAVRENFVLSNRLAADAYDGDRKSDYLRLKLAGLDVAPLQLAVFTVSDPEEGHGLGRRTLPETLRQSTAMAIHTLWLAARAENIGLGIVSILDPDAIARIFSVPGDWSFSAYLCLGHPAFADDTPLLHREGWQETVPHAWDER